MECTSLATEVVVLCACAFKKPISFILAFRSASDIEAGKGIHEALNSSESVDPCRLCLRIRDVLPLKEFEVSLELPLEFFGVPFSSADGIQHPRDSIRKQVGFLGLTQ